MLTDIDPERLGPSAIVYDAYLADNGWPKTLGVSLEPYFTEAYYRKELPVWQAYAPRLFSDAAPDVWGLVRLVGLALFAGAFLAAAWVLLRRRDRA